MSLAVAPAQGKIQSAGMGQIVLGVAGDQLQAVLGSCVGVVIYSLKHHVAALAHVVLPESRGTTSLPGKFADTAIPQMLQRLREAEPRATRFMAKLTGGAAMFATTGPLQIGEENIRAVIEHLRRADVSIAAQQTGGAKGRRILVDCATASISIESAGEPSVTI